MIRQYLIFLVLISCGLRAQQVIKGTVVEKDSTTIMPFVYIINKSNGSGTMSDNDGKFSISTSQNDTLVCSYVGYARTYVPVKNLKADAKGEVKLVLSNIMVSLNPVVVTSFKIKPYERDYMKDIIDRSRIRKMDYATSPISALYMRYSKEGKQIRKLAKIFEDIFIEEEVQKKLSPQILAKLTGDDKLDYEAFRKYCYYVSNTYIMEHEGAELYSRVMECYKRYKSERTK
ncbi:MAG: hypothetical protein K0S12_2202 [Bacteroidetes bacterium]|nr:hypothetical protein [Bacteroidota bacterium]